MTPQTQSALNDWVQTKLLPWKAQTAAYRKAYEDHMTALKAALPQLETMVGLLLDGKTRAAVLAWNTLGLPPRVQDIRVSADGTTLTLLPAGGSPIVLKTETLLAELEQLGQEGTQTGA